MSKRNNQKVQEPKVVEIDETGTVVASEPAEVENTEAPVDEEQVVDQEKLKFRKKAKKFAIGVVVTAGFGLLAIVKLVNAVSSKKDDTCLEKLEDEYGDTAEAEEGNNVTEDDHEEDETED